MKYVIDYPGLNESLVHFKIQVLESINYCKNVLPSGYMSPEDIFEWCKLRTHYKKDGFNEVFQSVPTLFENNYHGVSGYGDCDCFSILLLSCLSAKGYKDIGIVLVGRSPFNAVHIYVYCVNNGIKQYLDLTNKKFNFERFYPYRQEIKFKTNPIKVIFN